MTSRLRALFGAFIAGLLLSLTVPAGLAHAVQWQPLQVAVTFDKPTYQSGDLVKVDVTVKNAGSVRISGVHVNHDFMNSDALVFDPTQWGKLSSRAGIDLDPGAAHTVTLSGHTSRADSESVGVAGSVANTSGARDTEFSSVAEVTRTYGRASGVAFADKNGSGTFDAGEELPGATLVWKYAYRGSEGDGYRTTTDAGGRFSFPNIPTARYLMMNAHVDGWTVLMRTVDVGRSGNDNLRMRAVRPVRTALTASMKFTKDSYALGDLAHVQVTLSNSGSIPLTGIAAECDRNGDDHGLEGNGPGWGELVPSAGGVTVQAGQTRTFDVTELVPDGAFTTGFVIVSCEFGYVGDDIESGLPQAIGDALVPGGIGGITGEVAYYPEGNGQGSPRQPIAGVRVVLVDERPCHVIEQLTDKDGRFEFAALPAGPGRYSVYFYPPAGWRIVSRNPETQHRISSGSIVDLPQEAGPGQGQLPALPKEAAGCRPGPTPPPTTPPATNPPATDPPNIPAPQAKATGPLLANTGADDVTWLATLGAFALLLGSGLILATRRRSEEP